MTNAEKTINTLLEQGALTEADIERANAQYTIRLEDELKLIYGKQRITIEHMMLGSKVECIYQGECAEYKSESKNYYVVSIELYPDELMINVIERKL